MAGVATTHPLMLVAWMALFFVAFAVVWMFIQTFADILRSHRSGLSKARWIALIALLPFFGVLIYVVATPRRRLPRIRPVDGPSGSAGRVAWPVPADEIAKAAQLCEDGRITAGEFEILRRQALRF